MSPAIDNPLPKFLPDLIMFDNNYGYGIPVNTFIEYFKVEDLVVKETLINYPTLCYLLGSVTEQAQGRDSRPDGVDRNVFYLVKGSGMFGLTNPEDALRWKGIFNHIMGTARQAYWLATKLKSLTTEQRTQFEQLGYNFSGLDSLSAEQLRDFMLISHAGRRIADESSWHNLTIPPHGQTDPGAATLSLLNNLKADRNFIDLMRVETHAELLVQTEEGKQFSNIVDNILTYCDWTFGQESETLETRFKKLGINLPDGQGRAPQNVLITLKQYGTAFESALKQVLGDNIWQEMTQARPYDWEVEIRNAYCAPSKLSIKEVFLKFFNQFSLDTD